VAENLFHQQTGIMNRLKLIAFVFSGASFLFSCSDSGKPSFTDTPTSGDVVIVSDEAYQPLVSTEADTFMGIYNRAKVTVKYLPEADAFKELMNNDSIRLIVSARELNDYEKDFFKRRNLIPRTTKIAIDAVAIIVNNNNPDSLFRYEQLRDIVTGKISSWKQISGKSSLDSIRIVFDRNGSANTRYLKEKFLGSKPFPANCYATNSNAGVIDYVNQNKNAIGVISLNWISDKDDPAVNGFLNKISVAEISQPDSSSENGIYYKPYQGYIALNQYPLTRNTYIISREARSGLGTGFAAFVAGDQGQRVVRLMGMLPATMPVRLIRLNQ
jgi:phosphate transport system substrate-binding protein